MGRGKSPQTAPARNEQGETNVKHIAFNPTEEQRENLIRLATHLDLGVTNHEFDIQTFQANSDGCPLDSPHECGTVACAVGHGPSLGMLPLDEEDDWSDYAERVFGCQWYAGKGHNAPAFMWMFGGRWCLTDNTPRGAAARIFYALKHGIPKNFQKQAYGESPLSYTVPDFPEQEPVTPKVTA